jgi:D-beta-D-heptose 7-phosphate kinase/D-beta-D-heptose 1-phosphate adenosyltransferase
LIVGLNSDASVRRLKGSQRPIQGEQARAEVLNALQDVDHVVIFDEDTPLETIKALKPDILIKGADYEEKDIVGAEFVKSQGGRVARVKIREGHSTTNLVKRSTLS